MVHLIGADSFIKDATSVVSVQRRDGIDGHVEWANLREDAHYLEVGQIFGQRLAAIPESTSNAKVTERVIVIDLAVGTGLDSAPVRHLGIFGNAKVLDIGQCDHGIATLASIVLRTVQQLLFTQIQRIIASHGLPSDEQRTFDGPNGGKDPVAGTTALTLHFGDLCKLSPIEGHRWHSTSIGRALAVTATEDIRLVCRLE